MKRHVEHIRRQPLLRIAATLVAAHAVAILLYVARVIESGTGRYSLLLWNMFLALIPLAISIGLRKRLKTSSWLSWPNLVITGFWLLFLPNSFYLITDLIHLHQTYEVNILYDVTLFMSFIINGLIVGFMSIYMVHRALLRRVRRRDGHAVIALVLFGCSFAIYLGRFLRWNSWDVFLHPAGVLFDVSNQFIDPASPSALVTTLSFFLLLGSIYAVTWSLGTYTKSRN